jgi:hypothetical protein
MASIKDTMLRVLRPGRRRQEPHRESMSYPNVGYLAQTGVNAQRILFKPNPRNLRYFSRSPIARRAINSIKNPVSMLGWEITPITGIKMNSEIERQIRMTTDALMKPNNDDNFITFIQQIIEDVLVGAGAIEVNMSGDPERPVWLWPVDGLSIQIYPGWGGGKSEARYFQTIGYGNIATVSGQGVQLRDDELIYIRPNPNTASPFGFGPLEIAFNSISRALSTAQFAGKLAANALPPFMLDLGEVDKNLLNSWRKYWRDSVEGQGEIPIIGTEVGVGADPGKSRGATAVRLYPEGDAALFLGYQEFLRTEIAAAFDICNFNLGIERDVNRSTSEVGEDRDWDHALKPMAALLKCHFDSHIIHRAFGFSQIEFKWTGLDREDQYSNAQIKKILYDINVLTPNQIRAQIGEPHDNGIWGDLNAADVEIAKMAARGAAAVDDPSLPKQVNPPKASGDQTSHAPARPDRSTPGGVHQRGSRS